jgi:thiamine-monophosphate kinase
VHLSDIAAMGGSPTACVTSFVFTGDQPSVDDGVMSGLAAASERSYRAMVGGDTSVGPALIEAASVLDRAPATGAVLRSGARLADVVFVTGDPGTATAAHDAWRGADTNTRGWIGSEGRSLGSQPVRRPPQPGPPR